MKVAKTEQEIIRHSEGKGSLNCGLTAFKQGKKVILCTPEDNNDEVIKEVAEARK